MPAPEGWTWTRLGDVARLETGHTPSRKCPEYWGGDIPWIGIRDATANHGRVIFDTRERTNEAGIENSSARVLPAGTVCLSRTASVGYVVVMGRPMATSQDFVNWVCAERLDHTYLKYVLLAERDSFLRFASGTTHQTIYFPEVKAFHVCLPPPGEQRAIAHILGALDDKIELNRRMSETLDEMARAIFKSWFVDFDPVTDESARSDLPADLAACFPFELVEDPVLFGKRPATWHTEPLARCVEAVRGLSYKGSGLADAGVPLHNLNSIFEGGGYKTSGIKYYTGDFKDRHRVVPGDVVVANTEQGHDRLLIGFAAIVPSEFGQEGIFSHHLYRVRPIGGSDFTPEYVAGLLNTAGVQAVVSGYANGTTVNMLPVDALRMPHVVVPPEPLIRTYSDLAGAARRRQQAARKESQVLGEIRDTLLPKLISGELRVPDAEKFVESIS